MPLTPDHSPQEEDVPSLSGYSFPVILKASAANSIAKSAAAEESTDEIPYERLARSISESFDRWGKFSDREIEKIGKILFDAFLPEQTFSPTLGFGRHEKLAPIIAALEALDHPHVLGRLKGTLSLDIVETANPDIKAIVIERREGKIVEEVLYYDKADPKFPIQARDRFLFSQYEAKRASNGPHHVAYSALVNEALRRLDERGVQLTDGNDADSKKDAGTSRLKLREAQLAVEHPFETLFKLYRGVVDRKFDTPLHRGIEFHLIADGALIPTKEEFLTIRDSFLPDFDEYRVGMRQLATQLYLGRVADAPTGHLRGRSSERACMDLTLLDMRLPFTRYLIEYMRNEKAPGYISDREIEEIRALRNEFMGRYESICERGLTDRDRAESTSINSFLRYARLLSRLIPREVEALSGVSKNPLVNFEFGMRNLSRAEVEKVIAAYNPPDNAAVNEFVNSLLDRYLPSSSTRQAGRQVSRPAGLAAPTGSEFISRKGTPEVPAKLTDK